MTYREALEDQLRMIKFREQHYYSNKPEDDDVSVEAPESENKEFSNYPPDIEMKRTSFYHG
ncbi:hypothetical protein CCDG5_0256 [[Clostridium] cellulosi]|jgi:hypothetical protein|uniref:Uncharacterized protein n=1 Tax=[Clostridium] cellulosi TaxID=29343 RepID=A0A078KQL5_9FIRM|nr:hypothetical protein CCDG5_0256 [[Clostridium] cellulosi]